MEKSSKMPSSRSVLRRLVILAGVLVGVLVYAYGWRVTDISLEETQDPVRQDSMQRAMRELLSPDVFDQDRESEIVMVNFLMGCSEGGRPVEQPEREAGQPYVVTSRDCGTAGDRVTVEGFDFRPDADAFLSWVPPVGQVRPMVRTDIDGDGHFATAIEIPRLRGSEGEIHQIEVEGSWTVGLPYLSETTQTVFEKMVETLFLALMSTTIAVPIAAALSFLAARNLMRQIHLPLGNVLLGFILLPVGWVLGAALLTPVGALGVTWGKSLLLGIAGSAVAIGVYTFVARYTEGLEVGPGSPLHHLRRIVLNILLLVVTVFTLGAVGGLGVWLGEQLQAGPLVDVGRFIGTVGTLIELLIPLIAGLGGAFLVASMGMNLTKGILKNIQPAAGHILGAVLGLVGGAVLMILAALIANQAAWFGLFPPLIAALLGVQIVMMGFGRLFMPGKLKRDANRMQRTVRLALAAAAAVAIFVWVGGTLDLLRAIVDGRVPSSVTQPVFGVAVQVYLLNAAVIGAVLGGISGGLAGTQAVFPLGMTIYNIARTIMNALRSIEPLIMGIVFVIWVGIGPFAGMLALMLHSIAALGKLYSEQTESIDAGPLEAIHATGANQLQTIIYAVVPQIIPPYIAFTMYRWDINVRMSTIIGFVGGGGIGFLLQQQINLLRYRNAGVAVLAIAIVVSVLDYASASIRERIV